MSDIEIEIKFERELFIVRGFPGAGKTTMAHLLAPKNCCFAADDFFVDPETGEYNFDFTKLSEAHTACREGVEVMMLERQPRIAVHNTGVLRRHVQDYVDLAEKHGYRYHVLTAEGDYGTTHGGIPESTLERWRQTWEPWIPKNAADLADHIKVAVRAAFDEDRARRAAIDLMDYVAMEMESSTCRDCGKNIILLSGREYGPDCQNLPAYYICGCGFLAVVGVGPLRDGTKEEQ